MALAIHGVNKSYKNFKLSNFPLFIQIIIINFITAFLALVFLFLVNYFLLTNSKNIDNQIRNLENDISQITRELSKNAIIRIPEFNEEVCESNSDSLQTKCGEVLLSNPQLDPTSTQDYLINNYLNDNYIVKVYDDSWIKFADTEDIYLSSDVYEVDIEKKFKDQSFFDKYKNFYLENFNKIQQYIYKKKFLDKISKYKGNLFLVKETIKKQINLSYIFEDNFENIILINSSPILRNNNIYGVVLISGILNKENNEDGLISFNLINLFIIIMLIMFFLSFLFSRSIVLPIKKLSYIVRSERDKSNNKNKNSSYPERNDEIGILSNDIKSMSFDLKKRIDEIENFALDVSHELKNPLTSIKNSNELLLVNKLSVDKKNLLLKNMQKDIETINQLITDISSYTLTQLEIEDELFYIFNLVDFVKEFLQSYLSNNKKIKINFEPEKKDIKIFANKNKLAQVFINLIDNSFSYSPENSEILISIKIINSEVAVYFADQGVGIPNRLKDKVFERFYTDRPSEQDKHSGLGLSISKKIIESFYGSLELSSVEFKQYLGACFEMRFPLKE